MILDLTRELHPVGQGGFYTETLKNESGKEFNVVYDCGGNTKDFMEKYLKGYKNDVLKQKRIDAVFVSHLHADHINGLLYLLNNTYTRYLFLPQLDKDMLLEVLFYNTKSGKDKAQEMNNFIITLYGENVNSYYDTRVIKVVADDQARVNLEEERDTINISTGNTLQNTIKSGTKLHFGTPWLYIPYNPPVKTNKKVKFYDFIKKKLKIQTDFGLRDLPEIVKGKTEKELRKIYSDYFDGNHNSYSMTLFSGLIKPYHYSKHLYHCFCHHHHHGPCCPYYDCKHEFTPNCLYTGDFEAKEYTKLIEFYDTLWSTISNIQVPHHGSRNNYNPHLYKYAVDGFISVGATNKYHHPNIDTLINIHRQGCQPIVITDDLSTMFVQHFEF